MLYGKKSENRKKIFFNAVNQIKRQMTNQGKYLQLIQKKNTFKAQIKASKDRGEKPTTLWKNGLEI